MSDLLVTTANLMHCAELGPRLRPADALELEAEGYEPVAAPFECMRRSEESYAVLYGNRCVAMFGVVRERSGATLLGAVDVGELWFLTGEGFELAAWHGLKLARQVLAALLERYVELRVLIDARYEAAFRWARRLGFEILEGMPFGPDDCLFHLAVLRRS